MQKIIISLGFVLTTIFAFSQIMATKSQLVEALGADYKEENVNFNEFYLIYKSPITTKASGSFQQERQYYFLRGDLDDPICYKYIIVEPKTEFKPNIRDYKKSIITLDKTVFLDNERGYIVELILEENRALQVWNFNYDFNSSLSEMQQKYKQRRKDQKKSDRKRKRNQRKTTAAEGTYFG